MRILMIPTFYDGGGDNRAASARIRAEWVAKYWPECDLYNGLQNIAEYDAVIFQKMYYHVHWRGVAQRLRQMGKLLAFDLCDPVWEQGGRRQLLDMLPLMDFAVCPTGLLHDYVGRFVPAYCIPDGMDLEAHPERKTWELKEGPPSCVWYGYAANHPALDILLPLCKELGLPVSTISDKCKWHDPYVYWYPWALETVNSQIIMHDIVLNPQPLEGRWKYKSMNKSYKGWVLGMPVAHNEEELRRFLDYEERKREGEFRYSVRDRWDVRQSVKMWQELMEEYVNARL